MGTSKPAPSSSEGQGPHSLQYGVLVQVLTPGAAVFSTARGCSDCGENTGGAGPGPDGNSKGALQSGLQSMMKT